MKIALIGQPLHGLYPPVQSGSIEIWTYEVARRLAKTEEVRVYSKISQKGDDGCETYESVTYRRFPAVVDRYVAAALRRLPRLGLVRQPYYEFWSPLYYRGLATKIGRDLADWKPDVIHLLNFASFAPVLRAACSSAKVVLHMRCDWLTTLDRQRTQDYLRSVDLVLGCSHSVINLVREVFPQVPARTIHNAVDVTEFRPMPEVHPADHGALEILFVSRLSPEKGVHTLCEAFNLLAPRYPALRLRIVGPRGELPKDFVITLSSDPAIRALARFYPGDYVAQCQAVITPAYRDRVKFESAIPHSELPAHLNRGAILVQPSLWEPFGIPVIEAMACGLPVIAARVGGMPESVVDGETGLLFPPGDVHALADVLERLITNPQERTRLGCAGRTRAVDEFTYDHVVAQLRECYEG